MALEAGGYAEKLGNRYEANWIAYQLLRLLQEKISFVTVESIGHDEVGVDLVIGNLDGSHEHHQCKAGAGNAEHWSLSKLHSSSILKNANYQINRKTTEFHLVSPLSSKIISDLCESALNSNSIPFDFLEHQVKKSKEREKCFKSLCGYLDLKFDVEEDIKKAMFFLQHFKITRYEQNKHTQEELEDKASFLFSGNPTQLVQFLKYYPVEYNKLRNKITANQLFRDLKDKDFIARDIPEDKRILFVIENLSKEFDDSIRPFLICDQLIKRKELASILDSLEENAVTLIRAEAGIGKSSLLLELHSQLRDKGVISVPVRLDRRNPENNLDAYGKALGFPYSPLLSLSSLAKNHKVVIILDQLDAIRWTGAHSNIALQICQELVRQTIALRKEGADISIVLASRDFDLNDDIALSSWLKSISKSLQEVSISSLDEEKVSELVSSFEMYSQLSSGKKEILKIPLWLGIYLTIAHRTQAAPRFNNKLELVKTFWDDRLSQIELHYLALEAAKKVIEEIVELMMKRSQLSISESSMSLGSKQAVKVLISVGLLIVQDQRISFRHQALFDYQVGFKLYRAGSESPQKLLVALGDYDEQTLTKREHLKYALNMLLDANQKDYCACVEMLLFSDEVRFHLKFLVLNSLKDLKSIKAPAKKLINQLVHEHSLKSKFISISSYRNIEIIEYLINNETFNNWLSSSDEVLIDTSIQLLYSISDIKPDLVVKTLRPYLDKSDDWNQKIYSSLCWKIEDDSNAMFELRTELLQKKCYANYIDWRGLSKKHPERALSLIVILLEHYKEVVCKSCYSDEVRNHKKLTRSDSWSTTEIKEIQAISEAISEEVIRTLLRKITDIAESKKNRDDVFVWLRKDKECNPKPDCSLTYVLFSLIDNAGKQLGSDPDTLYKLVEPYLSINNPVTTHLVARLLFSLSKKYADTIIEWFLEQAISRLSCGNSYIEPVWILPGKLIEKFSVNCTEENFKKLEVCLYRFKSEKNSDQIKGILETRKMGSSISYWRRGQYLLLPKLDENRISIETKELIKVLNRKFATYSTSNFCSKLEFTGSFIRSPLPLGNKLSNQSWKKLILTPSKKRSGRNWKRAGKGVMTESSAEQFSLTLDSAVCNEPTRFAHFALSLPKNIKAQYVSAFFSGLEESSKDKAHEDYKDSWAPCSKEMLEQVIFHFPHGDKEYALVKLLERQLLTLSEKAFHLLLDLSRTAKEPEIGKLYVWESREGNSACNATPKSLSNNAINCVRGKAYIALAKLFFENEECAFQNKEAVDYAINDEHPAVKMSALELICPFLNYDENYAHIKFLELCNKEIRVSCGFHAYYFFNQGFEGNYRNEYIQLVLCMLVSQYEDVRKEAARQIYARWFFNALFEDELKIVINGDKVLRSGCASVLCQFLKEDKYHDRIGKIESSYETLLNDEDKDILREVGGCIRYNNYWDKHNSTVLFNLFVQSKSAIHCINDLFEKLKMISTMPVGMSDSLLVLVRNFVDIDKKEEMFDVRNIHIDNSSLLSVLQRIYDEATEDEDDDSIRTCLDIWDELLNSEIYTAMSAPKELDSGLLT